MPSERVSIKKVIHSQENSFHVSEKKKFFLAPLKVNLELKFRFKVFFSLSLAKSSPSLSLSLSLSLSRVRETNLKENFHRLIELHRCQVGSPTPIEKSLENFT